MPRHRSDRLYLVEKRISRFMDADTRKGPMSHLAKEIHPVPSRPGFVVLYVSELVEAYHPIRAFIDEDEAEAFCQAREDEAWEGINPFRYGSLTDWTSLDGGRLRDRMLDIGLEPPLGKFDKRRWQKWYDVASASVTEFQKHEVRQSLDRLHFHRVTELTA